MQFLTAQQPMQGHSQPGAVQVRLKLLFPPSYEEKDRTRSGL